MKELHDYINSLNKGETRNVYAAKYLLAEELRQRGFPASACMVEFLGSWFNSLYPQIDFQDPAHDDMFWRVANSLTLRLLAKGVAEEVIPGLVFQDSACTIPLLTDPYDSIVGFHSDFIYDARGFDSVVEVTFRVPFSYVRQEHPDLAFLRAVGCAGSFDALWEHLRVSNCSRSSGAAFNTVELAFSLRSGMLDPTRIGLGVYSRWRSTRTLLDSRMITREDLQHPEKPQPTELEHTHRTLTSELTSNRTDWRHGNTNVFRPRFLSLEYFQLYGDTDVFSVTGDPAVYVRSAAAQAARPFSL